MLLLFELLDREVDDFVVVLDFFTNQRTDTHKHRHGIRFGFVLLFRFVCVFGLGICHDYIGLNFRRTQ